MRRLLILTVPALLMLPACDDGGDEGGGGESGGGRNEAILALSGDAAAGESVFNNMTCSADACHGSDGNSGTAPALNMVVSGASDDQLINSVLDGKGGMPPQSLSNQEMSDVLAWLRATF